VKSGSTSLVKKDRKFTKAALRKITEAGIDWIQVGPEDLIREDAVKRVLPVGRTALPALWKAFGE